MAGARRRRYIGRGAEAEGCTGEGRAGIGKVEDKRIYLRGGLGVGRRSHLLREHEFARQLAVGNGVQRIGRRAHILHRVLLRDDGERRRGGRESGGRWERHSNREL